MLLESLQSKWIYLLKFLAVSAIFYFRFTLVLYRNTYQFLKYTVAYVSVNRGRMFV